MRTVTYRKHQEPFVVFPDMLARPSVYMPSLWWEESLAAAGRVLDAKASDRNRDQPQVVARPA